MKRIKALLIFSLMVATLERPVQQEGKTGQAKPSLGNKPAVGESLFTIYPGNGVPPGSENWTQKSGQYKHRTAK